MEAEITNDVMMLAAKNTALLSYIMIKSGLYRIIDAPPPLPKHTHTHTRIFYNSLSKINGKQPTKILKFS